MAPTPAYTFQSTILPDLKQTRSKRINDVFFTAKAYEQAAKDDGQAMQFSANSVK
jgi:hypothetical protein